MKKIKFMQLSFFRYLMVGILNTIVGFGIIFLLMYVGIIPELANLIGYCFGIIFSYLLNKYFTFKSKNPYKKEFLKFVISMTIAYIINLIILIISYRYFGIDKYISQIIAGFFYTLSGYILSKFYAFRVSES